MFDVVVRTKAGKKLKGLRCPINECGIGKARDNLIQIRGWRIAPGLAMAWGLTWIGIGRLAGEPGSTPIGVAAIVVAAVVLLVPLAGALLHRVADVRNAEV